MYTLICAQAGPRAVAGMSRSVSRVWASTKASRGRRHVVIRHPLLVGGNMRAASGTDGPAAPPPQPFRLAEGAAYANKMQGCQCSPRRQSRRTKVVCWSCLCSVSHSDKTNGPYLHQASVTLNAAGTHAYISPMRHQPHIEMQCVRVDASPHTEMQCAPAGANQCVDMHCVQVGSHCLVATRNTEHNICSKQASTCDLQSARKGGEQTALALSSSLI